MAPRSRVFGNTIKIGLVTTFVKLAGALKMVAISRYFGAGDALDAYLIAFLIPAFIGDSLAGAIKQAVLPALIEVRGQEGRQGDQLYSNVLIGNFGLLLSIALALMAFAHPLVKLVAPGFSAANSELARGLLMLMLPVLPLSAVNVLWRTLLNASDRFLTAALVPLVTPAVIIVAVAGLGTRHGVYALAAGTTAGACLEVLALGLSLRFSGLWIQPGWVRRQPASSTVARQFAAVAAANMVSGGSPVVDQIVASSLASGSVSILNYGTRLLMVLLAIGPGSLSVAVFPSFARLQAAGRRSSLITVFKRYAGWGLAAAIPAVALLMFYSEPLVRLVFQRGAFTADTTRAVALVQKMALLQIPVSVVMALLIPLIAALQANHMLFVISVFSVGANIGLDIALSRWLGVPGIALATVLVQAMAAAWLWLVLQRNHAHKISPG